MIHKNMRLSPLFLVVWGLSATLGPVLYTIVGYTIFMQTNNFWILIITGVLLIALWVGLYLWLSVEIILQDLDLVEKPIRMDFADLIKQRTRTLDIIHLDTEFRFSLLQRNDFDFAQLQKHEYEYDLYKVTGKMIELQEEILLENAKKVEQL